MWDERTGNPNDPKNLIQDAEMIYRFCHKDRNKKDSSDDRPPHPVIPAESKLGNKDDGLTGQNKTKIIHIHTEHHHHPDKDHDCAVCGAGKPKPIVHESVDVKPDASLDS